MVSERQLSSPLLYDRKYRFRLSTDILPSRSQAHRVFTVYHITISHVWRSCSSADYQQH